MIDLIMGILVFSSKTWYSTFPAKVRKCFKDTDYLLESNSNDRLDFCNLSDPTGLNDKLNWASLKSYSSNSNTLLNWSLGITLI
jgi:hypothetical protein